MSLVTLNYEGHAIAYQDDGWFNATQAAARFGKAPNDWLRLPATAEYIAALERKYGTVPHLKTKRGAGGGTWLHPRLAVMFARWLDLDFAIWCDEQIESLLRGKSDWRKLRHESAASFKVMTAMLAMTRADAGKETVGYHFSNEARLVNSLLSGEFKGLDRDGLSADDLALLAHIEERNAVLIGRGIAYDKRKDMLKQYAMDWRIARTPAIAAPEQAEAGQGA